jgi:hypothetical protein
MTISDDVLKGLRCAECGSGRLVGAQPGVDPRFVTAACRGCSPVFDQDDAKAGQTTKRVATFMACPEPAGWGPSELGVREPIPCLRPKGHEGGHSPKFSKLAPKTRGPIKGVTERSGGEPSKLPESQGGMFTELVPGWSPKEGKR